MTLIWINTFVFTSDYNKKMALLAWIVLVVIVGRTAYFVSILNGTATDILCKDE